MEFLLISCSLGTGEENVRADVIAIGYREIPNCPNKGIAYIVGDEPTAEGGASIEVQPNGTRNGGASALMVAQIEVPEP
jgi:hypothetical protein